MCLVQVAPSIIHVVSAQRIVGGIRVLPVPEAVVFIDGTLEVKIFNNNGTQHLSLMDIGSI